MSIMDINDIIGVPSEAVTESTLESEIAALSKIITDTKDSIPKLEDNDEDFKLDNDDLGFTISSQCDSIESDKCELLQDDNSLDLKDILDNTGEIVNYITTSNEESSSQKVSNENFQSTNNFQENKDQSIVVLQEEAENSESCFQIINKSSETKTLIEEHLSNLNNSLSLISDAYSSQESESCSESQPASVPDIEEISESMKIEDANVIIKEEETAHHFESVVDDSKISSDDTNSSVNVLIQEKLDKRIIEDGKISEGPIDQSTSNQNKDIDMFDQSDLIQTIKLEDSDLKSEILIEDAQIKDNIIDISNKLGDEMSKNDEILKNEEKNNIRHQECENVITDLDEEINDFAKNIVDKKNAEIKSKNNFQHKFGNSEMEKTENETENIQNTINDEGTKQQELSISDVTISTISKDDEHSEDNLRVLESNKNFEMPSTKSELIDKIFKEETIVELESDCKTNNASIVISEWTEEITNKQDLINIEDSKDKNHENLENIDLYDQKASEQVSITISKNVNIEDLKTDLELSNEISPDDLKSSQITNKDLSQKTNIENKTKDSKLIQEQELEKSNSIETVKDINVFESESNADHSSSLKFIAVPQTLDQDIVNNTNKTSEEILIDTNSILQNSNICGYTETLQNQKDSSPIESKNKESNKNIEISENTGSLNEGVHIANKNIENIDEDAKDKTIIFSMKSDETKETEVLNKNETPLEELLISKNKLEDIEISDNENKNLIKMEDKLATDSELQDDRTSNKYFRDIINENIEKPDSTDNKIEEMFEKDEQFNKKIVTTEDKTVTENAISNIVEKSNELNINIDLLEAKLVEETKINESKKIEVIKESKNEEKIQNDVSQAACTYDNTQEQQDQEEISLDTNKNESHEEQSNLLIDPDECSSPVDNSLNNEATLVDPLSELIVNENVNSIEMPKLIENVETDYNEVLKSQQRVKETISSVQDSNSKEIALSILSEVKTNIETEFNEPTEFQESIHKDKISENSLSLLDTVQTELVSTDHEMDIAKEVELTEKIERATPINEKFNETQAEKENEKFINSICSNRLHDTIESGNTEIKDVEQSEKSMFTNDQNKIIEDDIIEKQNVDENLKNPENFVEVKGNTQSEQEGLDIQSNVSLDNLDNESAIVKVVPEISELGSAVKFLQESEEQDIMEDSTINEETSSIFVSVEDNICDNVSEIASDLPESALDPIAISEAEIISESAKLENQRKKKIEIEHHKSSEVSDDFNNMDAMKITAVPITDNLLDEALELPLLTTSESTSESLPKVVKLDDCCKDFPLIEIPEISTKILDSTSISKPTLFIQKDVKLRLDSPERHIESEIKSDTPKKDFPDKQQQQQHNECENVGSPRIILKIAKSAIADCSEPRSPKSPKIRSAANSPNPEDSPGHKLSKIKLKLSKGGHPSIIPNNDNYDETAQWHTDNTSSLSPLGMKIKLTKSADVSTTESKQDEMQKQEEIKEKILKTEVSIGMKIKLSKSGDASIVQQDCKETASLQELSVIKKQDSPSIGMKIKLSKSGDASIIQQENQPQIIDDSKEVILKAKDKVVEEIQETTRRIESPIGMKIKLSKSGDASVIPNESLESLKEITEEKEKCEDMAKRTDSTIGVKIKLAKTKGGNASIIPNENTNETKDKNETIEGSKKVKSKKKDISEDIGEIPSKLKEKLEIERFENSVSSSDTIDEGSKIGMKFKLLKTGDASVVHTKKDDLPIETIKKSNEHPIGMKIKLSRTGDPSIVHSEVSKETDEMGYSFKIKHFKSKDHSPANIPKSKDDLPLEMKIKLSKTGHPTIITSNEIQEDPLKVTNLSTVSFQKHKDHKDLLSFKDSTLKNFKKSYSDTTIEPMKSTMIENAMIDLHNKRKEITIAPIESKKTKIDTNLKQMLPDITIQPIVSAAKKEQQKNLLLHSTTGNISRQQMNIINKEISITQICSMATGDTSMGDHSKNVQNEVSASSPLNSDCEIIERSPQPELIIVNENSNSSQDIMIIGEVSPTKSTTKMPKKRGRPRRNAGAATTNSISAIGSFREIEMQRDPLSLDQPPMSMIQQPMQMHMQMQSLMQGIQIPHIMSGNVEGSERPRRTCRSQKSYAPPRRGRGRGRGKRKNEALDIPMKKSRIEQDLTEIENAATAVIALEKISINTSGIKHSSELFKALNKPALERVTTDQQTGRLDISEHVQISDFTEAEMTSQKHIQEIEEMQEVKEIQEVEEIQAVEEMQDIQENEIQEVIEEIPEITETASDIVLDDQLTVSIAPLSIDSDTNVIEANIPEICTSKDIEEEIVHQSNDVIIKVTEDDEKIPESIGDQSEISEGNKDPLTIQEDQHWLAPSIKKMPSESVVRNETISTLTVIDEETRMSAESNSRSQTPARNISGQGAPETLANEESQGSVLSTATTESEKVKVRNRRMEINFDPDEGPFTVDKIAEYEWPLYKKEDRQAVRSETYMIQEQISHYLGVKSFKRKYPDLKRRVVDMEERNFLRENGLVSESMCDMGLTAVSSFEVLDIMCNDFREQYEEYGKYVRDKKIKEHSKKQKELLAAANAERNRIDLAEMAIHSTLSWNAGLNRARQDSRKCSLDLQTFTVHVPIKRPIKFDPSKRGSHYPVAIVPGQYTDYFREYTPAELRYYPLNTVLYGPMRPNERKLDSQSEGSQSDSDSDSSSDDSSSSSSEGTQDTEGSHSTMDEVDMELSLQSDVKCKICQNNLNKSNRPEVLIQCGTCSGNVHPSCIDLTVDMVPHIRAYAWQCTDCKTCAQCHDPADEDKMLFCDMCDRGYHIYCVGLRRVPQGRWHCQECAVCANCGSKEPGGANSDRNSVALWQHEYKKGDKNTRVYVSTFCVPCSKLRGNQGSDN